MPESWKGLGPGQLQEIDKWRKMGFTGGQIIKQTGIRRGLVYAALKHLRSTK